MRGPDGYDASAEQHELAKHDRIVLQFPFRWCSAPPLLTEWLEIALERGWAHGPGGHALEGEELSIAVSTWSRAHDHVPEGRYGRTMDELTSPFATTAARVGMSYRPGFFVHGIGDLSDAEHEEVAVVATAWNPATLRIEHPRLQGKAIDVLDADAVLPVLAGIDAVISCIGIGASKTPTTLYSQGTRNLMHGMATHGVERLVVISSEVAEHWAHQGPLKRWIVLPLLQTFLGATHDDMRRMDITPWESGARWTALRAPRVQSAATKGGYRLRTNGPLKRGWMITAADLANSLLDIAERDDLDRRHVYVAD